MSVLHEAVENQNFPNAPIGMLRRGGLEVAMAAQVMVPTWANLRLGANCLNVGELHHGGTVWARSHVQPRQLCEILQASLSVELMWLV